MFGALGSGFLEMGIENVPLLIRLAYLKNDVAVIVEYMQKTHLPTIGLNTGCAGSVSSLDCRNVICCMHLSNQ